MKKVKEEKVKIEKNKNAGKMLSDGTVLRKKRVPKAFKYFVAVCFIILIFIGCLYFYIENNVDSLTRKCSKATSCKMTTDKHGNKLYECEICDDKECKNPEIVVCQAYGGVK